MNKHKLYTGWSGLGLVIMVILLAVIGWAIIKKYSDTNPLATITAQYKIPFTVVYPTSKLQLKDVSYSDQQQTLSFTINYQNKTVAVTEQPAPEIIISGQKDFLQALDIKPSAQFSSRIGQVAVSNVYDYQVGKTTSSVTPIKSDLIGQAAITVSGQTLVIARVTGEKAMDQERWQTIFDNLKVAR